MHGTKTPKVNLRRKKRKKGYSYSLDYFINGKRIRENIGIVDQNVANQILNAKIEELLIHRGIKTKAKNSSLKDAIERHYELKKLTLKPKTISSYKNYKERIFSAIDELGEGYYNDLRFITEGLFNNLVDQIRKNHTNQHTANGTLTFLKAAESTAIRKGYLEKKFSGEIVISKPDNKLVVQFYNDTELEQIWNSCDRFYVPIYKFLVSTGLRLGELVNLTWDKVDIPNMQIHVNVRVSKTDGSVLWRPKSKSSIRTVPLSKKAKEIVIAQKGKNDTFVFTSKNGEQLHSNSVYNPFVVARNKAKVTNKGAIHALRHTFASKLAQSNKVTLYTIGNYLGHSREETTRIYAHLCPSDDSKLFDKIGI